MSDTHSRHDQLCVPDGDVLVHAGNHDLLFESDPGLAESLITNATYLRDSAVTVGGLKFYGSPWQPWFLDWAFNLRRGPEIKRKWDLIPDDTDVLITHGPPHGILDLVPRDAPQGHEIIGCEELLRAVGRIEPKVHIFGHIHEGYGTLRKRQTTFVNASICDANYRPVNEPIVVEVDV